MKYKRSHWICGLSLLLCVTLLFGMLPTAALASWADADQLQYTQEQLSNDYSEEELSLEESSEDALPEEVFSEGELPSEGSFSEEKSDENLVIEEDPDEEVVDSPAMQEGEGETYKLELSNGRGILESSGPESAKAGDQVTVSVTIEDGYYFSEAFYNTGYDLIQADEVDENTVRLTFEMPAQDVLLFIRAQRIRRVILVQSDHGTISADRTEGKEGDLVKLTAEPDPGYVLGSWHMTVTDESGVTDYPVNDDNTFNIKWGDMTVRGNFVPDETDYAITIDQQIENGTVRTASGQNTAKSGETVTLTAQPAPGYQLESLTVTDGEGREVACQGPDENNAEEYSFQMPSSAVEVTASFALVYYEIRVEGLENIYRSTVYVNNEEAGEAGMGDEINVRLRPEREYRITKVTWRADDGEETEIPAAGNDNRFWEYKFTLEAPGKVTIHVYTERTPFALLSDYDDNMGRISFLVDGQETDRAFNGDVVTVDVQPMEGYALSRLYHTVITDEEGHDEHERGDIIKDEDGQYRFIMYPDVVKVYAVFTEDTTIRVKLNWEDNIFDHKDTVVRAALKKKEKGSEDWTIVETIELKESGEWKGTFSPDASLDGCDVIVSELDEDDDILDDGDIGSFKVKKDGKAETAFYQAIIEQDPRNQYSFVITNKPAGIDYSVQKVWEDDTYSHDNTVVRAVLMKEEADGETLTPVEVLELTKNGGWKGTFSPVYTQNTFRIYEMDGNDENKVLKEGKTGYFTAEKDGKAVRASYEVGYEYDPQNKDYGIIITNKLKQKEFSVEIVWEEDEEKDHGDRKVKVELQKKEAGSEAWTTEEVLDLGAEEKWKGTYKPVFFSDGDEFRVCEQDDKGSLLTGSGETGFFQAENFYPAAWQPAWYSYEVDYDFEEEDSAFTVSNWLKQTQVISADLRWEGDYEIDHEKPVTAVLRVWDEEQGRWVEKEEIQLTKDNNWKGTFSENAIKVDDKWEVREKDKDGNLVENEGLLVPFMVMQNGAEKQEYYSVKYDVFDFDPLNPVAIIINKGSIDRVECKIKLVWEDGEEGITHNPLTVDYSKVFGDGTGPDEEETIGRVELNSGSNWEAALFTAEDNKILKIFCEFNNDEGRCVITGGRLDAGDLAPEYAGKFTGYKNGESISCDYLVTSKTIKGAGSHGELFETTLTLTRVQTGMRTSSVKIDWDEEPPAAYKPESLTAQLLHLEYAGEEQKWVAKAETELNDSNNWEHTFDPLPDDGNEEHYLIDLLNQDGERIYCNENTRAGWVGSPWLPGYVVMKYCVRSGNAAGNIVEYAFNAPKSVDNLTTIQGVLLSRYFSVRNIRIEEPAVTFAKDDIPVRSTYILQHQNGNGEWEKIGQTEPTQPEDGKFFEVDNEWTYDNYRVREIDEQGNAVEENDTIVLSARKDNTPLLLQYRVNYGQYGEYQAGEFPVTKTLQGLVFPVEIKWKGEEDQSSVQVVVQSSPAGAEDWEEVQDCSAELSTQNQWAAQAGPAPWRTGRKYRVRAKVGGQVVEDGSKVEIDGNQYYFAYKVDDNGKTVITVKKAKKMTCTVVKEWEVGNLAIDAQKDPLFVRLVLQHLEDGNWKEIKVLGVGYEGNAVGDGAGWRCTFEIEDTVETYRVLELDTDDEEVEDGQTRLFDINVNGNQVQIPFKASYQFQADEENENNAGTFTIKNTYDPEKISVYVSIPNWEDHDNEDGLRPYSVTIRLLADDQDTGQTVELTRNNKYQLDFYSLNKKNAQYQDIRYTVKVQEDNVITGQDGKLTYSYEAGGDAANGYTFTLKHTPQTVTCRASVTWEDHNDQDGKRPLSVDLILRGDGGAGQGDGNRPAINLTGQGKQWDGQFPAQPAVRNGREINYTIEQNTPQGYQYAVQKNDNSFIITYTHNPEKITISGSVVWVGDQKHINERPASVDISLYAGDQFKDTGKANAPAYTFIFNNLDRYAGGHEINYSIRQNGNLSKYQTQITHQGTLFTITNTRQEDNDDDDDDKEEDDGDGGDGGDGGGGGGAGAAGAGAAGAGFKGLLPYVAGAGAALFVVGVGTAIGLELNKKIDVSGKVTWNHGDNPEKDRPEGCTVQLLANGEIVEDQYRELTVNQNPDWKYTFSKVPKYHKKSSLKATKYTVTANSVPDYTASFSGMNVTYTYTPGKTQAAVNIVWDDIEDQDGIRPESVDIRLTNESSINKKMTLRENDGWAGIFTDLDSTQNYKVDVVRTDVINGSDSEGTYAITISGDQTLGFFIRLTHTPKVNGVSGKITWEDGNDQEKKRPEEVTVTLMAQLTNGDVIDMTTVKDDEGNEIPNMTKTVKASDGWKVSFTFDKIPVAEDGGPITWFLKQEPVDGYITTVNGMTVLNTLKTAAVTSFSGTIAWEDNDNAAGDRPDSVRLRLLADGTAVDNQIRTVTAGPDQVWNWSFEELPQFNKDGSGITYSVTEDAVPDYTAAYTAGAGDSAGTTITNTYAPETMDLTIRKIWEDDSDAAGDRPENVTVHLFADGDEINADSTPAGAASGETDGFTIPRGTGNTWSLVLKGLRRYRAGKEIDYSVTEEPVEEYQSVIDGLDITNTYAPTTQDIEASVIWQDNDDAESQRPESVTIRLYADDTELEDRAVALNAQNADENGNWTYTFTGLPRTREDEEGNPVPVVYEISEDPVTDYNESVNGFNVTNTFSRQTRKFTGTVTWDDADDQDGIRPDKVLVRLLADGEEVEGKTEEISALQDWKWNFTKLPKYEKGREIIYSVTEEQTSVLTGTDGPGTYTFEMVTETADPDTGAADSRFLKNTHTPEMVTVAGKKTWEDNNNAEGGRPESIMICLLADGTELTDKTAEIREDEDGLWKWSFPGLPRYAQGKEISYSIHEDPVPDYTAEVDGYDVKNTYTPDRTQVDVVVKWDDDDDRDGIRPQTVTIQLCEGNTPVTGRTLTLSEADNWQGSFTDLPISRGGTRIGYNVSPETTDVLSGNSGPGTYGISLVNAPSIPGADTGNYYRITFDHKPETIDISGTKTWVDDDNYGNTRPESINIRLMADGAAVGLQKKVTAEDDWKWSFAGLPKYRDGKAITYTIYEDAVKNYTAAVDGMNVVNTISFEPEFKNYALLLTGLIGVNIYMDLPGNPEKYRDSYMTFSVKGKEGEERADFNRNFRDSAGQYYGFTGHINSIQMAEPITCTFHYFTEDGEKTKSKTVKVSNYIRDCGKYYANYPKVLDVLRALGNYGHYVQPYLSDARGWKIGEDFQEMFRTSEITSDMIDHVKNEAKAYAFSIAKASDSKVSLSYSLNLESGTLIHVYIKPEKGKTVSAKLDGKELEAQKLSSGYYVVIVPDIPAHNLDKMHTMEVTAGEENISITLCALSYVNTVLNPAKDSNNETAKKAVTALFNYFLAADAYTKNSQ